MRPLGIAALEDKIVQHAVGKVLAAIYEEDFLGFSYGFRQGRGQHDALDALFVGLTRRKVNWVLDADIKGFFDAINHEWMQRFVEHRIADPRIIRLVRNWLRAGVSEDGQWSKTQVGTPQGAVISPLLANIYLQYALDQWVNHWRKTKANGDIVIVRYADDFVIGFQHKHEAEGFLAALKQRLEKFSLALHPEKTRLITQREKKNIGNDWVRSAIYGAAMSVLLKKNGRTRSKRLPRPSISLTGCKTTLH